MDEKRNHHLQQNRELVKVVFENLWSRDKLHESSNELLGCDQV